MLRCCATDAQPPIYLLTVEMVCNMYRHHTHPYIGYYVCAQCLMLWRSRRHRYSKRRSDVPIYTEMCTRLVVHSKDSLSITEHLINAIQSNIDGSTQIGFCQLVPPFLSSYYSSGPVCSSYTYTLSFSLYLSVSIYPSISIYLFEVSARATVSALTPFISGPGIASVCILRAQHTVCFNWMWLECS